MDELLQLMEEADLAGVQRLIGAELTGEGEAWATHLALFPLVQRVQNPPFINPHLPKMYRIMRDLVPYLAEEDIPPLVRLEITEYTRRPKAAPVVRPASPLAAPAFAEIESAIGAGEVEQVAALLAAFLAKEGAVELARRLLLLGSGYLDRSLGHSISCTAFILLELLERPDHDPWPVLGSLADYFCRGHFHATPALDEPATLPSDEEQERQLLRATSGTGIVNLHHTITRYAMERVRHLLSEREFAHLFDRWVAFMGDKSVAAHTAPKSEPATDYDQFYRTFARHEVQPVLSGLAGLLPTAAGRALLGRFLVKGVCDQYQGDYNPHNLTGLGAALWVVEHYAGRPAIAASALGQYLDYFFSAMVA